MRPLAVLLCAVVLTLSCRTVERGAANDPRKCELDPNCARKPGNYNDCATSCADNYDCMMRCTQVTGPVNEFDEIVAAARAKSSHARHRRDRVGGPLASRARTVFPATRRVGCARSHATLRSRAAHRRRARRLQPSRDQTILKGSALAVVIVFVLVFGLPRDAAHLDAVWHREARLAGLPLSLQTPLALSSRISSATGFTARSTTGALAISRRASLVARARLARRRAQPSGCAKRCTTTSIARRDAPRRFRSARSRRHRAARALRDLAARERSFGSKLRALRDRRRRSSHRWHHAHPDALPDGMKARRELRGPPSVLGSPLRNVPRAASRARDVRLGRSPCPTRFAFAARVPFPAAIDVSSA